MTNWTAKSFLGSFVLLEQFSARKKTLHFGYNQEPLLLGLSHHQYDHLWMAFPYRLTQSCLAFVKIVPQALCPKKYLWISISTSSQVAEMIKSIPRIVMA